MRTRRLDDGHGRGQSFRQGKSPAAVKHRRLRQRTGQLMRALSYAVSAALQGLFGQIRLKPQVGPMGFIDEDKESFFVGIGRHGL